MKAFELIVFLCFVQIFIRSTASQYIGFGQGFGVFYGNGPSIPNGSGRSIGGYSHVSQDLKTGENCQIGSYCTISTGCSMGDNVLVSDYVQMDQGVSIGSNCQIMEYARLGPYVTMGSNNLMNPYVQIKENADIGSGCIMGMYANFGPHAKLERNVYAGDHCQIGSNAMIGENSIIQPYAAVPDNGYVGPNEMVIKTPTTSQLYENCLPLDQIPQSDIDLAADHGQPENLNGRVRQLMSSQKQNLESSCHGNAQSSVDFKPLGLGISLYLIRYDGLDQFTRNVGQQGNGAAGGLFSFGNIDFNGEVYFNGMRMSSSSQAGRNDQHFVEGSPKKFLEPELENDMVELLALKEDSQRSSRVPGDTFCKTVSEVKNKQRKVKCDQALNVGPKVENDTPQRPNQGRGEGHPLNNSPSNNPNNYQPNRTNQQPLQPNIDQPPNRENQHSQQPKSNNGGRTVPQNQGSSNLNRDQPPPPVTEENDVRPSNPAPPTPSYSNNHRPTQGTNQSPPGHPLTSNNQPNQNQPPTQQNSANSPNCNQCNIQPDTSFGNNIEFGNNLNIGKGATIGNNCRIKDSVNVGDGVMIGSDAVVSENTNIGNNCVLDDNSNVGPNANIGSGSYVGKNCDVGANAFIGENAIVLDNAKVPDGGYIGSKDVVMPTPTSADLYSSCAPIERVPQNVISQPDPNNNLRQMMRGQIAKVRSHCQQQSQHQQLLDFAALASAKTIYLLSLHGIPNFTANLQNVMNKASGNGNYDARAYQKLMKEEHFVDNGQPSRIEPDVKGEMIVLMAIEQDFGRENRSPGDSFCQTFMDIASNQRQVKCDK